jgi:hypothetical protein
MRVQLLSCLVALVLAVPGTASADLVTLPIGDDGFDFGLSGLDFEYAYEEAEVNGVPVWLAGPNGSDIRGRIWITALFGGVDLTSDGTVTRSSYTFGPGHIRASASWTTPNGVERSGSYHGVVESASIDLCEQQLSDEDMCGDVWGDSNGDLFIRLGAGRFERPLARALGVRGLVTGGSVLMGIDGVTGDPSSRLRLAGSSGGSADVDLYTRVVPEPSAWLMMGLGAGAVLLRRSYARR